MAQKIIDIKSPQSQPDLDSNLQEPAFQDSKKRFFSLSEEKQMPEKMLKPEKSALRKKNILFLVLACALIAGAVGALSLLGVEVKIWPALTIKDFQENLLADSSAAESDFVQKVIPARVLTQESGLSGQFDSSLVVPKEIKARGAIRVYNNYNLVQILVAGTRFLSPDEKLFRSTKRVSIPAQSYLDVEVAAAEPGPAYNIGPTTFSVPGLAGSARYTAVFGKSSKDMEGGFLGKTVKVSKDDLKNAELALKEKLMNELKNKLTNEAELSSMIILEKTISPELIDSGSLVKPDTEIDKFDYAVKMKTTSLAFNKDDLEKFAKEIIAQKIGQEAKILPGSLKISFQSEEFDPKELKCKLLVNVSAQTYSDINISEIKNRLLGKELKEGKEILAADPRFFTAQVRILSFWKTKFPQNPDRVEIKLMFNP